jgi:RHS repeat-associated protein
VSGTVFQVSSSHAGVSASASGSTVYITATSDGSQTDYQLSTSYTFNSPFTSPAFTSSASGSTLTGGGGSQNGSGAYHFTLAHDPVGNVINANDNVEGNQTFTYDVVNRLWTAGDSGGQAYSLSYGYDAYGNLTCNAQNPAGAAYVPTLFVGMYATQGRYNVRVSELKHYYGLNHLHYFTTSIPQGGIAHLFDPEGNWLGNAGSYSLVRFDGRYFALYLGGNTLFNHVNALDSASMRTLQSGAEAEDILFYPWGDVWEVQGSGGYNFANMPYRDVTTSTDITTARFISPNFGRWFSPDPIGVKAVHPDDPQTWNMYAYVRNNPTTNTDPTGLACVAGITLFGSHFGGRCGGDTPPPPLPPPPSPVQTDQTARTALMAPTRPSSRTETVYQIGGIVNAETQGMKDSKSENVPLSTAREEIAEVRINGDQLYGDKVGKYAVMQPPLYSGPDFQASLDAAANAAYNNLFGVSDTGGATNYQMTKSTNDTGPFYGLPIYTTAGPYLSPTPFTVINTYGPLID